MIQPALKLLIPIPTDFPRQLSRFVLGAAFVYLQANLLVWVFLYITELNAAEAYAFTQIIMIFVNFTINRKWVFRSNHPAVKRQLYRFIWLTITFRLLDWVIFTAVIRLFLLPIPFAIFIAMSLVFPTKFLVYRKYVFTRFD